MKIKALFPLILLLASCAVPATHFGDMGSDNDFSEFKERSFVLSDGGAAGKTVRTALINAGFEERDNARLRVEIGFSIRPVDLALVSTSSEGASHMLSPAAKPTISLCHKHAYVMTLAFVDRRSGKVISRSGATLSRCRGAPAEILSELAHAALPPIAD
ncbi:MAG: hypothetical protein AB7E55_33335 [Pigmentiphaga sp.]